MVSGILNQLVGRIPEISGLPFVGVSALEGDGVEGVLPAAFDLFDCWNKRVSTSQLNAWLKEVNSDCTEHLKEGHA